MNPSTRLRLSLVLSAMTLAGCARSRRPVAGVPDDQVVLRPRSLDDPARPTHPCSGPENENADPGPSPQSTPRGCRRGSQVLATSAKILVEDPAPTASGLVEPPFECGQASFYWEPQPTASGERFDPRQLTAAHPSLPFGTRVRVVRAESGEEVTVRINDRGPFIRGRIIDLSRAAARKLDMVDAGLADVELYRAD